MSGNLFSQYTVTFEKDEVIYNQNETGSCMFVIKDGKVGLYKMVQEQPKEISELTKGDFFGELSILEHSGRMETARAKTKCSMVVIHRGMFVKMLKANMEVAIRMLQKLSSKLLASETKLNDALREFSKLGSQAALTTQPQKQVQPPKIEKKVVGKLISLSSNRSFILSADRNLVGRYDPVTSVKPEVDLTYEDDNRSVSRRHAVILRRNNSFYVQEEIGVLNGTYVNGSKATAGGEHPLKDQDMINFGMLAFKFYLVDEDN